jgi:RimJ/RimL family protein N-acetyltransferase
VEIETARLLLRPMAAGDVDALLEIFGDPGVMAAFDAPPFDRSQMERWVRRNLAHQDAHGYGLFAVLLRDTNLLIGDCGLEHMVVDGRAEVELGYDFRRDQWNRGYASEAAAAVRDFAFTTLGLRRVISLIRTGNAASRRVAEKVGMRVTAEIHQGPSLYLIYAADRPPGLLPGSP